MYAPWMEDGLRHSVFLPDHSLRYRRLKSTRRRGGIERKEMVPTYRMTTPPHSEHFEEINISNHTITTNTTHSPEQIQTHHTLRLAQPADIAARHPCEERSGDASGCWWRPGRRDRAPTRNTLTSRPRTLRVLPLRSHRHFMKHIPPKQLLHGAANRTGSSAIAVQTDRIRTGRGRGRRPGGDVHSTRIHRVQTSECCHTEAEEGREGPDKYIDTEQILGLSAGHAMPTDSRTAA